MPPKIIEEKSTLSPSPFKEGSTLKLHCHSEGQPASRISWYFRKRHESQASRSHGGSGAHGQRHSHHEQLTLPRTDQIVHEGDTLVIHNVTRLHSGSYECIANNSVPPAASRKFKVIVECKPVFLILIFKVLLESLCFASSARDSRSLYCRRVPARTECSLGMQNKSKSAEQFLLDEKRSSH